jgi:hypothetical protein
MPEYDAGLLQLERNQLAGLGPLICSQGMTKVKGSFQNLLSETYLK